MNDELRDYLFGDVSLEDYLQGKVNEVAEKLIIEFPTIAKDDPKRIGKMAKAIVFDAMPKAIDKFTAIQKGDNDG